MICSVETDLEVVEAARQAGAPAHVFKAQIERDLILAAKSSLRGKEFVSSGLLFDTDAQPRTLREILFCFDDAAIVDGFARFIATALKNGNPAIALVDESHQDDLLDGLRGRGVDIATAIRRGTYISLDASVEPDPDQFLEAIRSLSEAAAKAGKSRPRVAFCGERAGRLWADGKTHEAIQLERFCDRLVKTYEVDILCVYPLPQGQNEHPAFENICKEHSAVYFR